MWKGYDIILKHDTWKCIFFVNSWKNILFGCYVVLKRTIIGGEEDAAVMSLLSPGPGAIRPRKFSTC